MARLVEMALDFPALTAEVDLAARNSNGCVETCASRSGLALLFLLQGLD